VFSIVRPAFSVADVPRFAAGLARAADGPGWELWLEVEERTADLFMAYLAVTLGALQEVAMDPVTNRRPAFAALLGVDTDTGLTLKRARELRLGVLDELLPAPAVPPTPRELAEFKREHGPQLAAFRDRVDEELLQAALLPEQDAREERANLAARGLLRERDDIVELMGQRRWPRIVFGSVAGVAAAAAAVAAPFLVGGGVAAAALAAPGLLPAVYTAASRTWRWSAGSTTSVAGLRASAHELLSSFDLSEAGDRLVRTYSGGMRRRLDLAAALVARPPVLFLDEPTTGLDIRSRIGLWDAIEALVSAGTTVLLTTQYLDEADRLADRIAVVDHGLVIAEGTPAELKTRVGGERLDIHLCDSERGEEAVAALASIASDRPFLEDGSVRVPLSQRRGTIADAVRRLDDAGIAIDDISVTTPTLDDVFLKLTGRAAEPESEEAEVQSR
jgi:ABC transporter